MRTSNETVFRENTDDIPDGRVFGMSRSFTKGHLKVGAAEIEKRDWKVYSK